MVWPHKAGIGIKLVRMGCANRPYYQIGAMPSRRRTGLLPDEVIGSLDPVPNERNEIVAAVNLSRLSYWMGKGGRLSYGCENLLGLAGWTPVPPRVYLEAKKAREEENKPASAKEATQEEGGQEDARPELERILPKKLPF